MVGAAEPQLGPWLRAAGHETRGAPHVKEAVDALGEAPADLVIADREAPGRDVPGVCRALREDPRLGEAWLLAITSPSQGRRADAALNAGADDYLHRPFTRGELLARARAGVRAAQQRADDKLVRALHAARPRRDLPLGVARRATRSSSSATRSSGSPATRPRTSSPARGGR